ncbi:hypothetical protein PAXINDRAFT_176315 [Paxillus involutus ATCC 200175]|uniref:7alpha-cephem-methoxylase P8 chain n=1 Tax=Paxillus involutus ATCC 200175 TaxID=664439 RepID=A0A0C9U9V1_PAXIN|nr:hypothetical protein PAXINDRAFT_176315 [Paxillus involutus ATCC 200175]
MSADIVSAKLLYFSPPPDGSRPYFTINADPATGERGRNWAPEEHTVPIENVRGKEHNYTLDTAGFQFVKKPAKHTQFVDEDDIRAQYYPESVALLKGVTGASRVVLFDHTVRRHMPGASETDESKRQPVTQVHVDQTPDSATARVYRHLPSSEAESLVKKRFQIINLWRPIAHPSIDYPLALCDFRSVDPERDLVPVALIYPDREGETFGVRYNEAQRWKYQREMGVDEAVLIKCYDSSKDKDVAVFTPHTGFRDPSAPRDAPLRESVEVRALVFYD